MKLAFEVVGSGPPLIVLHGLLASAACWRDVAHALAGTHRVISVDLRNHGRSPAAASMAYPEMADDVLQLIESERLERPALLGHSMGGKVAMALALMHPGAVGAVAVVDIAPVDYVDRWSLQLQAMRDLYAGVAPIEETLLDGGLTQHMLPRLETRTRYVDWRSNLPAIGLSIQELCAFPRRLRHLRTDVGLHAIVGARSDYVSPPDAKAYAPMFPRARVEVIGNAGHWIHAEDPAALVGCVRRRLTPAAAGSDRTLH